MSTDGSSNPCFAMQSERLHSQTQTPHCSTVPQPYWRLVSTMYYCTYYRTTYLRGSQNPLKSQLLWRSKTTSTNTFFFFFIIFIFIIIIIIIIIIFFFFLCG